MASREKGDNLGEFDLIARYFKPLSTKHAGAYNLEDDCASLSIPTDEELVVSCDTIVAGVHFFANDPPDSIAVKALGVNLSDIAAKGAEPHSYLLSLSRPKQCDESWLEGFASGLGLMQDRYGLSLIGGDTVSTSGPLSLTVTIMGTVPKGEMVRRSGASSGDGVYVTGTIGDSFLGLQCSLEPDFSAGLGDERREYFRNRYLHPQPRFEALEVVRAFASSCMDVSDGLAADFGKLCRASGVGGVVELAHVPLSEAATEVVDEGRFGLSDLVSGGDDYELLLTVPSARQSVFEAAVDVLDVPVTRIGVIQDGDCVTLEHNGVALDFSNLGYDHFS